MLIKLVELKLDSFCILLFKMNRLKKRKKQKDLLNIYERTIDLNHLKETKEINMFTIFVCVV